MNLQELQSQLEDIVQRAASEIGAVDSEAILHQTKARFIGKAGDLTKILKSMRDIPAEDRPAFGKAVNEAKARVEGVVEEQIAAIKRAARSKELSADAIDLTLPGRRAPKGGLHPLRQTEAAILEVFRQMGYSVAIGPEVETDFHNFEALNFPPDHPARDMQDTFLVEGDKLLRTHTSPVQIRTMLANEPPIRIAAPGAVYRCDELDMTHSPCFSQVEGLVVDRGITMSHLKGTLQEFVRRLFQRPLGIRLRPSFFPFTEPSVEVDIQCVFCGGEGCRVCSHTGWIEILGAGMVDPNVFRHVGIDPDEYTGFAFGIGIERVAMLYYDIEDIRLFFENDIRFLSQFA